MYRRGKKPHPEHTEGSSLGEWVSVEDRLPEHNKTVITHFWGVVGFAYYNSGGKSWREATGKLIQELYTPTHWMPLPAPPMTGEGEGR